MPCRPPKKQTIIIFFRVIDYLVQPYDIRVLQPFHNFEFIHDTVICCFVAIPLFLEEFFVHFFESILDSCVFVFAKIDSCKGTTSQFLFYDILVDHFMTTGRFGSLVLRSAYY